MKKLLLAAALQAAFSGLASAADLPSRKEPISAHPSPPMWTGFYAGLNAGGIWSANNSANVSTWPLWVDPIHSVGPQTNYASSIAGSGNFSSGYGGFVGGGQIGYNWQVPVSGHSFVTGIEADIQGVASGSNGSNSVSLVPIPDTKNSWLASSKVNTNLSYIGTVRGRIGYLVTPTLLVYGTGGLAYGGTSFNTSVVQVGIPGAGVNRFANPGYFTGNASSSNTLVGWTGGGGVEWMFMPNWSAKAEYSYYDLGNASLNSVIVRPMTEPGFYPIFSMQTAQASTRFNGNIVRAGVNYHFNFSSAPVVAKF